MSLSRPAAAREIVRCCRSLGQAGLIAGADGNVSVRLARGRLLVTPSGGLKARLVPGDLVEVDPNGKPLHGSRRPTSELDLHLRIYRRRPDCGAVVHAHPPAATAFAVAGESIPGDVLPEITLLMGSVPLVPYAMTGTPALGDAVEPFVAEHQAVLLANHGAVAWGRDLQQAWIRMESLEHVARILLAARALGRVNRLTREQVHALERLRGSLRHGHTDRAE